MKDQTIFLRKFGISAGSIGDEVLDLKIEIGERFMVFWSPESFARDLSVAKVSWKTGPSYKKYLLKYSM